MISLNHESNHKPIWFVDDCSYQLCHIAIPLGAFDVLLSREVDVLATVQSSALAWEKSRTLVGVYIRTVTVFLCVSVLRKLMRALYVAGCAVRVGCVCVRDIDFNLRFESHNTQKQKMPNEYKTHTQQTIKRKHRN